MKTVKVALLGAGGRGMDSYAPYALKHPNELKFVAVAEPDKERRDKFKETYKIEDDMCFNSWEELLSEPRLADAIMVCTQDKMHFEPTMKALEKKYHVLLEKPMSPDPQECVQMVEAAEKNNRLIIVCHVLRYTSFFSKLKELLDNGKIGRLISIQHNENVGFWHFAHSFVRGNWRNTEESSPFILAKSCHDMDILHWLADAKAKRISSFGSLTHFKSKNAPSGAPKRCLDGCLAEKACQYYAPKTYLTEKIGWPASVISSSSNFEDRVEALKTGPYGRCVYHCDNDVVDHQVVNIEFENEVTAVFSLSAFTNECTRTIKLMGTNGEIRGHMDKNEIEVIDFNSGSKETIKLKHNESGHGGGDYGLMSTFVRLLREDEIVNDNLTLGSASLHSHIMAFAAEEARLKNKVVVL